MNKDANQDLFASHALINYLSAAAQGSYAYHNALMRLSSSDFKAQKLDDEKIRLEKIWGWRNNLHKGECLFAAAWDQAQTFESRAALKLAEDLRSDLIEQVQSLSALLNKSLETLTMLDAHIMCAALARFYYAKENYMRGFVELAKAHALEEVESQYTPLLEASTNELRIVHDFIKALSEVETLSKDLAGSLRYQNLRMPGAFYGQAHEINQLVWRYRGGFGYESMELDPAVANRWVELGVPPQIAGYWIGYGIGPDEALAWNQLGLGNHEIAAAWKLHGFSPDNAAQWAALNFHPAAALQWASMGMTPEQALDKIREQERIARIAESQQPQGKSELDQDIKE